MPEPTMPTPAQHGLLAHYAQRIKAAPHGRKTELTAECAGALGVSPGTASRWLSAGHRDLQRKRRADAGRFALTREEALAISAVWETGRAADARCRMTLKEAIDIARNDGLIRAEQTDSDSGEITRLSDSSVARAMRHYGLHPEQMQRPTAHQPLSSPHPNWLWQVDASVCVVYYLPSGGCGLCEMKKEEHYKNKPQNIEAIKDFRVIRYVATDHASGVIRVRYYPHAESGQHTAHFIAWLMAPKQSEDRRQRTEDSVVSPLSSDPFHGKPWKIMVDPGATASGTVKRFCEAMDIELIVNEAHNPRAKGQVENANWLWERKFESKLNLEKDRIIDFPTLNRLAEAYQIFFNQTFVHSRHGKTRFAAWGLITPEQLIVTAPLEQLLEIIASKREEAKVKGDLTVAFAGGRYWVKHVPGVSVGQALTLEYSPFLAGGAVAVVDGENGRRIRIPLPKVEVAGDFGFPVDAPTVGEAYKRPPETPIETNRKEVDKLLTGEKATEKAAAARARKGFVPFLGQVDPFADVRAAPKITYLPRAGTPMEAPAVDTVPRLLPVVRAARRMRDALGDAWNPETFDWLTRKYPDGVPEDELARLIAQASPTPLVAVS
ncbi:phage associated protein [Betaproteobacteria bacterium]|nr:phage associated protein [Betaproteobacteria bacterium]